MELLPPEERPFRLFDFTLARDDGLDFTEPTKAAFAVFGLNPGVPGGGLYSYSAMFIK